MAKKITLKTLKNKKKPRAICQTQCKGGVKNVRGGLYTDTVMEHFAKPHNYGKIENPDGIGKVGNVVCGDVMWLYIKVGKINPVKKLLKTLNLKLLVVWRQLLLQVQLPILPKVWN